MPKIAKTDLEIESCFEVMAELRPQISRDSFVQTVREMEEQGYQLAYLKELGAVVAVAGFRINSSLFMGKNLYVDDLVTSAKARSQGFGKTLIIWLRELAKQTGCKVYHLDSGTQRGQAHKFYFRQGMTIVAYHFLENLSDS